MPYSLTKIQRKTHRLWRVSGADIFVESYPMIHLKLSHDPLKAIPWSIKSYPMIL